MGRGERVGGVKSLTYLHGDRVSWLYAFLRTHAMYRTSLNFVVCCAHRGGAQKK